MIFLPEQSAELWSFLGALVTLLVGLMYFFFPRSALGFIKLTGNEMHPEAFGEARSMFAGFLIASAILMLTVKKPELIFVLALGWSLASIGKIIHVAFDGSRQINAYFRLGLAMVLAVALWVSISDQTLQFAFRLDGYRFLPLISALIALAFGVLCMLAPGAALQIMRLRAQDNFPAAKGEIRGVLGGFFVSAGLSVILLADFHLYLMIGLGWLLSAFGRIISMLSDNANNMYNWISLILELVLAGMPFLLVMGIFG